jgi:hypothetical protein
MKVRNGFVSNSSTSSFICEVCGRTETEWDSVALKDMGFMRCENEHLFCEEEALQVTELVQDEDGEYNVNQARCPICTFTVFSQSDLSIYLEKMTKISRNEAFAQVKALNKRRKKLYDNEYNMYACIKANIKQDTLLAETKEKFGTYEKFRDYLSEL